jgi:hypothetical protein
MKIYYVLLACFLFTPWLCGAQSTVLNAPVKFTSKRSIDLYSGQQIQDTLTVVISKSVLRVESEDDQRNMALKNLKGAWEDLSVDGEVAFEIPFKDFVGQGKLGRENESYYLLLDFSAWKDGLKRRFFLELNSH